MLVLDVFYNILQNEPICSWEFRENSTLVCKKVQNSRKMAKKEIFLPKKGYQRSKTNV